MKVDSETVVERKQLKNASKRIYIAGDMNADGECVGEKPKTWNSFLYIYVVGHCFPRHATPSTASTPARGEGILLLD